MERTASPTASRERRSPTPAAVLKREAIYQLKGALEEEAFFLHYQPIVSARDSRLAGVEALLRWRAATTEKEAPTRLIWAAERSPVIFKLENWTLREAFRVASAWPGAGLSGLRVNVNLSAREFPRADLVGRVTRRLASAEVQPRGVGLEITETSSIDEFAAVAEQLERLIAMGIELWLDDFG